MKRIGILLAIVLLFMSCTSDHGYSNEPKSESGEPVRLMLVGDLHYLSPTLYEEGELFERVVELGDGKVIQYTPQILRALIDEVLRVQPDGLILAGDLTFNGERESHEEVAAAVKELCASGVRIYAIPGNHDVNYPWTYKYFGDVAQEIKSISSSEFQTIYSSCGVAGALTLDEGTCGFISSLADDLWLVALDANAKGTPGQLCTNTYEWMEEHLKSASKQGVHVITFSHQTLLDHNAVIYEDYTMHDASKVTTILERAGVHLNLSAHMHIQHIVEEKGLYDVATGAISVYPHLYGLIEIDEGRNITYSAHALPLPEEITEASSALFERTMRRRVDAALEPLGIEPDKYDVMSAWAIHLNSIYYRGEEMDPSLFTHEAIQHWKELASDTLMGKYLLSLLEETPRNHRHLYLENQ